MFIIMFYVLFNIPKLQRRNQNFLIVIAIIIIISYPFEPFTLIHCVLCALPNSFSTASIITWNYVKMKGKINEIAMKTFFMSPTLCVCAACVNIIEFDSITSNLKFRGMILSKCVIIHSKCKS